MRRMSLLLPALLLAGLPVAVAGTDAGAVAAEPERPAYTQTKHLNRTVVVGGQEIEVDARDVTVTVDRTTQLRGRERVVIAWSGAHPTGGRAANPFGEQGLLQEYPVVILQCRGLDDPSLPAAQQLSPSTCWTSSRMQRTQLVDESEAAWRHDRHATEAERAQKSGLSPIPPECSDVESFSTHITPFVAANGTVYPSCTAETMPPEAAVGAAFPPAELAAYTDVEGNGAVKFEVRSSVENESLGCSDSVPCSIVVIPIQGISCLDEDPACSRGGQFEPGASNFAAQGVDLTVSPLLWWAPSNWRNRFSVPIEFGLAPDACDVLDDRPPTGFYGSELLAQAALQWSPAYCLDEDRFKFQHNKMPDEAAFTLMETGGGAAALVSSRHETRGTDPVAYAPTAVTGFSIGYVIDRPENAGELTDLRLNPRLIAKLITQSYLGSEMGRMHPGMASNPVSINLDPEFQALNPGLDTTSREAAATLLSLSESSDVIEALTSYVAQDEDAMAFIDGKADPWGMTINPNYRKIDLPRSEWPLLDDFVPTSFDECRQQNPAPYFTQIAAPVTSLRKIAEAILDSWPNVQTKCERASLSDPWRIGRVDRQGVGSRFMLGLVSLGDARRLGLREAALQTRGSTFVTPTDGALARALAVSEASESGTEPFTIDIERVIKAGSAYPGTMIVYTAARTSGMEKDEAAKVAQFIEVATTEGQRTGYGNGELPDGYLPIRRTGPTAPLFAQARAVAEVIAAQSGAGEEPVEDGTGDEADAGPASATPGSVTAPGADLPEAPAAQEVPGAEEAAPPAERVETGRPETVAMPDTRPVSSSVANRLIPTLLGITLLGAVAATVMRLALARRRPR